MRLGRARRRAWVWPGLLVAFVLTALLGPLLAPVDPDAVNLRLALRSPSPDHLLGTDQLGRDVLARVTTGGRAALLVGLATTTISIGLAILVGGGAGFVGGRLDAGVAMLLDTLLTLPGLLVTLAILGVLGAGAVALIVALVGVSWATDARILRTTTATLRQRGYVEAARATGAGQAHILLRHVVPNAASVTVVLASLALSEVLLVVSGLSFLGLGIQPPTADWGTMLADGRAVFGQAPWLMLAPGLCIVLFSTLAALTGDAMRDLTDPAAGG
jgi:peptide/nickel transport system permease protein